MRAIFQALVALILTVAPVLAQTVQQSGSVTPGHATRWCANGVICDAGTATAGSLTSLGVTASGPGICQNSGATTGAFNRVCLQSTSTGGGISMTNVGGATGGFTFVLNGTTQGITTATLPVTTNDLACFADTTGTIKDCGGGTTGLVVTNHAVAVGTGLLSFTSVGPGTTGTVFVGNTAADPSFTNAPALLNTQNASSQATITNASTGTAAFAGWGVVNSANGASFGIGSTGYTGLGSLATNRAFVDAASGTSGILFNNEGNSPIVIGRSNVEIARFPASGGTTLDLGTNATGTGGSLGIFGASSGKVTITPQATASTPTLTLPNASGTFAVSVSAPLALSSTTGNVTITGVAGQVLAGATPAFTATPTLGVAGASIGTLALAGNSSGTATITPQAAAGTPTLTLPNNSGTFAVTATSPIVLSATTGNLTCATCVTSSGGGAITGTAPVAVSAAGVVSITGAAGQVLAGASPAFTATPTLGASGTLGSLTFGNATSGLLTLQAVTGALGTVTVSIPATTTTLAGLGIANVFTLNQALTLTTDAALTYTITNASTGTAALGAFQAVNSANTGLFGIGSTGYTGITILQNSAFVHATSGAAGIVIDNAGDKPTIFARLNTEIARFNASGSQVLTVGSTTNTVLGSINFAGSTSGGAIITAQAAAGTPTLTLGTTTGTIAASATSPLAIAATTGVISCATCGVTGTGLGQFASTTSATFFGVISDETGGTGVVVGNASPTFTTQIETPKIIGGTAVGSTLLLQSTSGVGTTDFVDVLVGNAGASRAARFLNGPFFLIGGTANVSGYRQQIDLTSGGLAFSASQWSADVVPVFATFQKSRGASINTQTIVQSGDNIGFFSFSASDGVGMINAAAFGALVDGTPGTNDMPGRLTFQTTADGSATLTERMRIDNSGGIFMYTIAASAQANALCYNSSTKLVTYNSGVTTCLASMASVKDLHAPIKPDEALRAVMAMQPWTYRDRNEQRERIGLVAEYVAEVDERLVARNERGELSGVRYEQYTAHLTGAIQALKAANDNLKIEIETLKQRIAR